MTADLLTVLIVVSLGAFAGTGAGLIAGYLLNQQKPDWEAMSKKEKIINIALILAGSAICIGGLAWYAFK
jgi:hypothetical protein